MRNYQLEALRTKRNDLLEEARKLVLHGLLDEAKRTQFDNMRVEIDALGVVCDELERGSQFTPPLIDDPSEGRGLLFSRTHSEQRSQFERYIRTGQREQRDLTAGASPGQEFVPQEFYPVLTEAQKAWGPILLEVTTKVTPTGAPMKVAFATDVSNVLHESGEPATISETDPTLSSTLLNTDILDTGVIKVTVQELQDSAFDLDAFIREIFGKRFFRGLTAKVTAGSTSGNIEKILNANVGFTTTEAGGTDISYDDVVGLWSSLDPAYLPNAIWVMNNSVRGLLLGKTDTLGRPLYVPAPSADAFDTLLGKRVVLNQSAPNVGSAVIGPIQYGDFRAGYLLRQVRTIGEGPGLAIVRLNERYMDTLEVGFIGYVRAGGLITDAGTHPIQTLKMAT